MASGDRPLSSTGGPDFPRRLDGARLLLNRSDDSSIRDGVDEVANLAAQGYQPALRILLQEILRRRLAERPIRRVLLDAADIADAEQTTLIAVAERVSSFEGRARFTTWLETVARNEALMVVRRRQRKSEATTDELPDEDRLARRLSSLIAGEQALEQALRQISAEHRAVIQMREQQDLSYDEIAVELGVPVGTVRSRISRARAALAELLLSENYLGR